MSRSSKFRRDGADIHSDVAISFTQAALGGEVKTPGLTKPIMLKVSEGRVESRNCVMMVSCCGLQIPPGIQSHHTIKLRGRGIPRLNSGGGSGDHYVHVKIRIPK